MASSIDRSVVKRIVMELLEEDEEFRLAVAAKVGLLEILQKLEEHDRKFNEILERLDRNEKILLRHEEILKRHEEILMEHTRKLDEHSEKLNRIEVELGALTESFYCRALWDDLCEEITSRGEKILVRARNYRVDEADIDLFIETSKTVYVVEVKVKPKHGDVNKLIDKADIVRKHYPSKEVVPVLAGALIGREVQEYARSKGVKVYVY